MTEPQCIINSAHGVYIPSIFAERYEEEIRQQWEEEDDTIPPDELLADLSDPGNRYYWDAWQDVLDHFELNGQVLVHDGDLFLVDKDKAENWEYI